MLMLKRVSVPLTNELLQLLLTQDTKIRQRVSAGLPAGARLIGTGYEVVTDQWLMVFEHESFAPVPEGAQLPRRYIVYEEISDGEVQENREEAEQEAAAGQG